MAKQTKTRNKPSQLDRIENSVKTLAKHVKSQDAMLVQFLHQLIAGQNKMMNNDLDTHSNLALLKPPVEEVRNPYKVGDFVTCIDAAGKINLHKGFVGPVKKVWGVYIDVEGLPMGGWYYHRFQASTIQEIATYEQEKEASRKAEQEASKLSKLKFGVKVMTPQGEGFYHYHDGDKEINAPHWISLSDGTTDYFPLSDITIVG